jgi:hypothetical protein
VHASGYKSRVQQQQQQQRIHELLSLVFFIIIYFFFRTAIDFAFGKKKTRAPPTTMCI